MTNKKNKNKKSISKEFEANNKTPKVKFTRLEKKNFKITLVLLALILVVFYFVTGLIFTAITALGLLLIIGLAIILKKSKNDKKKRRRVNRLIIVLLSLCIIGITIFVAFFAYIMIDAQGLYETKKLNTKEVSIMYDKNGDEIIKLGSEMREKITYDQLPEVLVDAIIATEDSRFFQHNGLDAPRFAKASLGQLMGNSNAGGASTLSMQVIKNTMTSTEASGIEGIIRKFTDVYLSVFHLEQDYSKQEIIEFYVNNHFLGGNVYGVQEASMAYFGKDVSQLNLSEAAVIAGLFQSPNIYRPDINPENAENRRETVLHLMETHGYITAEEAKIANEVPVESLIVDSSINESSEYQDYIDTVVEEMDEKHNLNPYVTPLLIYTNMDPDKQDAVNSIMSGEDYSWKDDKVQAGVSVLDADTGQILAIGAGRNREGANQWNYATQNNRQPGSTAKPLFDYAPGIEYNNWSTAKIFNDAPHTYSGGQSIKNWDNGYFGNITLRTALATSRNIPALKAFQEVDNDKIIEMVTNLGITPEISNGMIHEAHSIGGFNGTNSLEMSAAYAAFANGGYYNEPSSIKKYVNRETNETVETKTESVQAMSDATAYMITDVLEDIQLTGGTPTNIAAKTGTTNYDVATINKHGLPGDAIPDSWLIGYSPDTVMGLWYGYDFIDSDYVLRNLQASIEKDKIWKALLNAGAIESNRSKFEMPDSVVSLPIVKGSNPPAIGSEGGNTTMELFKKGHEPTGEVDDTNTATKLANPGNFNVSYDGSTAVTMSWNAVARLEEDEAYGELGYNIFKDGVLIAFTKDTRYVFNTSSPYGVYKIVATYKDYNSVQSGAVTYNLEEEVIVEPEEPEIPDPENPEIPDPEDPDSETTP